MCGREGERQGEGERERELESLPLLREEQHTVRPTVPPYLFCGQPGHSDDFVEKRAAHSVTYSASSLFCANSQIKATLLREVRHTVRPTEPLDLWASGRVTATTLLREMTSRD